MPESSWEDISTKFQTKKEKEKEKRSINCWRRINYESDDIYRFFFVAFSIIVHVFMTFCLWVKYRCALSLVPCCYLFAFLGGRGWDTSVLEARGKSWELLSNPIFSRPPKRVRCALKVPTSHQQVHYLGVCQSEYENRYFNIFRRWHSKLLSAKFVINWINRMNFWARCRHYRNTCIVLASVLKWCMILFGSCLVLSL